VPINDVAEEKPIGLEEQRTIESQEAQAEDDGDVTTLFRNRYRILGGFKTLDFNSSDIQSILNCSESQSLSLTAIFLEGNKEFYAHHSNSTRFLRLLLKSN